MLRFSQIIKLLNLLILITSLFANTSHAATLTLPQTLKFDGLTFLTPLTIPHASKLPTQIFTFNFDEITSLQKITITKKSEIKIKEVNPTPSIKITQIPKTLNKVTPSPTIRILIYSPTPIQPTTSSEQVLSYSYNSWGLNADMLFNMSNEYRSTKGLPPFQKDDKTCQLASSRAPEINSEISEGHMHSGLRARNLPYWNTENIISMQNEIDAFNWWINDKIHRESIEGNYKYSCVACAGKACAQEFTNYQPK